MKIIISNVREAASSSLCKSRWLLERVEHYWKRRWNKSGNEMALPSAKCFGSSIVYFKNRFFFIDMLRKKNRKFKVHFAKSRKWLHTLWLAVKVLSNFHLFSPTQKYSSAQTDSIGNYYKTTTSRFARNFHWNIFVLYFNFIFETIWISIILRT